MSFQRDDPVQVLYADAYVSIDLPHVVPKQLRLKVRLSYTRENALKYYGVGNASRIPPGDDPSAPRYEYGRTHPTASVDAEHRFARYFTLTWGMAYTHNWLEIPRDGLLAEDIERRRLPLDGLARLSLAHGAPRFSYGVGWDDRDDEVSASRGQYHTLKVALFPGGVPEIPYRFMRWDLTLRVYLPLWPERVTLAVRALTDLLFGDAPFYELSRYEDTYAIGGSKGVRGVPAQRYHGKAKLLGNLEVRTEVVRFRAFDAEQRLGVTAFADAGRVWADYRVDRERDGTGIGLKFGLGGGPRWRAGKAFVLRADVAWSPDADPVGAYLLAGQMF
jgi:outer membrane protein assembly factor BamA